ncbi:hypothetical protein T12_16936 [Trichinella patagoniensis]|nr:hypothetical protein T12_16936 [Trichinella patagoniensis]
MSDGDLGRRSFIKHRLRIFVESVKPIKKALSLIEAANLRWSSPVVLGKIKDGISRFCIDYRKLNEVANSTYRSHKK